VDPRLGLLALLLGLRLFGDALGGVAAVQDDGATRIERPKALVERAEKPRR
jgi:hypothetical protein